MEAYTEAISSLTSSGIRSLARQCGFELAGVAPATPVRDLEHYRQWAAAGMAGEMRYLADRRAQVREDPRAILPSARSVISVGKLYNTPHPPAGPISRYAWGDDYHDVLRAGLERLAALLRERLGDFESRICVDTAPLLERAYAREAGLGWTGKNTCLINQTAGSWFFLGELLVEFAVAPDAPPADRCGTCTRCLDACPTQALTPYQLDARRCIAYLTIELRGPLAEEQRTWMGGHVFGCDICQDVCPWNRRAPVTGDPAFAPRSASPPVDDLAGLAALSEDAFRERFRRSPVRRAKYPGFLRNLAAAMGHARRSEFRQTLERLGAVADPAVAGVARRALQDLP